MIFVSARDMTFHGRMVCAPARNEEQLKAPGAFIPSLLCSHEYMECTRERRLRNSNLTSLVRIL